MATRPTTAIPEAAPRQILNRATMTSTTGLSSTVSSVAMTTGTQITSPTARTAPTTVSPSARARIRHDHAAASRTDRGIESTTSSGRRATGEGEASVTSTG